MTYDFLNLILNKVKYTLSIYLISNQRSSFSFLDFFFLSFFPFFFDLFVSSSIFFLLSSSSARISFKISSSASDYVPSTSNLMFGQSNCYILISLAFCFTLKVGSLPNRNFDSWLCIVSLSNLPIKWAYLSFSGR